MSTHAHATTYDIACPVLTGQVIRWPLVDSTRLRRAPALQAHLGNPPVRGRQRAAASGRTIIAPMAISAISDWKTFSTIRYNLLVSFDHG